MISVHAEDCLRMIGATVHWMLEMRRAAGKALQLIISPLFDIDPINHKAVSSSWRQNDFAASWTGHMTQTYSWPSLCCSWKPDDRP